MHPAREKATSQLGSRFRSIEERFESALGGGDSRSQPSEASYGGRGYGQESGFSSYATGGQGVEHSEEAEEPYRQPDFAEVEGQAEEDETFH